jgi:hypothetical protein
MTQANPTSDPSWQSEIRALEEQARLAFLTLDYPTLEKIWADDFTVNSPLNRINTRDQLFALLKSGRVRHLSHEITIESLTRHGNTVIVMGRDQVTDPPDNALSLRRFTNIWQLQNDTWRLIARHAHVLSRTVPATPHTPAA